MRQQTRTEFSELSDIAVEPIAHLEEIAERSNFHIRYPTVGGVVDLQPQDNASPMHRSPSLLSKKPIQSTCESVLSHYLSTLRA